MLVQEKSSNSMPPSLSNISQHQVYLCDGTISHVPFLEMRAFTPCSASADPKTISTDNRSIPLGLSAC